MTRNFIALCVHSVRSSDATAPAISVQFLKNASVSPAERVPLGGQQRLRTLDLDPPSRDGHQTVYALPQAASIERTGFKNSVLVGRATLVTS